MLLLASVRACVFLRRANIYSGYGIVRLLRLLVRAHSTIYFVYASNQCTGAPRVCLNVQKFVI